MGMLDTVNKVCKIVQNMVGQETHLQAACGIEHTVRRIVKTGHPVTASILYRLTSPWQLRMHDFTIDDLQVSQNGVKASPWQLRMHDFTDRWGLFI